LPFPAVVLASALSAATLVIALPVFASDEARAMPALLVARLRVADIACQEAATLLPSEDPTPDGSARWAGQSLEKAATNLLEARDATVDPAETERLERLAFKLRVLSRELPKHAAGAPLALTRLRFEIRAFSDEVQRRIDRAKPDPIPLTRPSLSP
jgi:hypothetical protein